MLFKKISLLPSFQSSGQLTVMNGNSAFAHPIPSLDSHVMWFSSFLGDELHRKATIIILVTILGTLSAFSMSASAFGLDGY